MVCKTGRRPIGRRPVGRRAPCAVPCGSVNLSDLRWDGAIWKSSHSTQLKSSGPPGGQQFNSFATERHWNKMRREQEKVRQTRKQREKQTGFSLNLKLEIAGGRFATHQSQVSVVLWDLTKSGFLKLFVFFVFFYSLQKK